MSAPPCLIVEHKTTTDDCGEGSDYRRRLRIDSQVSTYFVGARALGYDPTSVLYDVCRKPLLRPSQVPVVDSEGVKVVRDAAGERVRTKDGKKWRQTGDTAAGYTLETREETPEEYGERVAVALMADPSRYFQRFTVVRLAWEEEEAAFDTWQQSRLAAEAANEKRWPRNADQCIRLGSRECSFFALCSGEVGPESPRYRQATEPHEELADADVVKKAHLPLWSNSAAATFRRCAREYYWRYVQLLRPAETEEPLRFGRAWHLLLEAWWAAPDAFRIEAAMQAFDGITWADAFEAEKARALICAYHLWWEEEQEALRTLAVEAAFVAPLRNPTTGAASKTWLLAGRIDALAVMAAETTTDTADTTEETAAA